MAQFWPYLTTALTILLSVIAAVHAVLEKRDVRAAVGWVGLIVFVPIFGAIFYYLLGINRIHRRAKSRFGGRTRFQQDLSHATVNEADFELAPEAHRLAALVAKVTGRPLLGGNEIIPLRNGEATFPAMLAAIGEAQASVSLCTYIFDNDSTGEKFVEALAAAVRRGVQVRVLVDDAGTRYTFPSIVHKLRRAQIPHGRFMRTFVPGYLPYMNLRNHRKIMVVDGIRAFTGGINIRAGHWITKSSKRPVQDLHFQVRGPMVAQLQAVFAQDWAFAKSELLEGRRWFPPVQFAGDVPAREVIDGPNESFGTIEWTVLGAITCARRTIRIATPYFLPELELQSALKIAALRGVGVEILLPDVNNLRLVQWASLPTLPDLMAHGIKIFFSEPPFDHSKFMLVDDYWSFFGSSNLDPRSLRLNFECNIEAYSRPFAATLLEIWYAKVKLARQVTKQELESRSVLLKIRDGVARLFSPYL